MKLLKNDRLVDLENETEWTFNCKTRAPEVKVPGVKTAITWTCVLNNKIGERRFIPEEKMATLFKRR